MFEQLALLVYLCILIVFIFCHNENETTNQCNSMCLWPYIPLECPNLLRAYQALKLTNGAGKPY